MKHEELLQQKQDEFEQKLTQYLECQNPELLQEWNEIRELQNLPKRIEEIRHKIEECLAAIRNAGLTPLWKAYEDIRQLPQDDELLHQANMIEQFIKDVDSRIHRLREELESDDRSKLSYWKKHGVNIFEVRDGTMKET